MRKKNNKMLQPTDGGYTNGYHHDGAVAGGIYGGHRVRRGSRGRPRGRRGGGGSSDGDARVSLGQQHNEDEEEREKPAPPCTEFDTAYFNSYAHVGIHEEMIKVFVTLRIYFTEFLYLLCTYLRIEFVRITIMN